MRLGPLTLRSSLPAVMVGTRTVGQVGIMGFTKRPKAQGSVRRVPSCSTRPKENERGFSFFRCIRRGPFGPINAQKALCQLSRWVQEPLDPEGSLIFLVPSRVSVVSRSTGLGEVDSLCRGGWVTREEAPISISVGDKVSPPCSFLVARASISCGQESRAHSAKVCRGSRRKVGRYALVSVCHAMPAALQASLLCRPSPSRTTLGHLPKRHHVTAAFTPRRVGLPAVLLSKPGSDRLGFLVSHALTPGDAGSTSERVANGSDSTADFGKSEGAVPTLATPGESSRRELAEDAQNATEVVAGVEEGEPVNGSSGPSEVQGERKDLSLGLLLMGLQDTFRGMLNGLPEVDWLRWWPWRHKRRLEHLIADADANPKDAAKQSALLAELNKFRFVC